MYVLHVGAGKCGSSALQHYYSNNPVINTDKGVLAYHVLNGGKVLSGSTLAERASKNSSGYVASQNFNLIEDKDFTNQLSSLNSNYINLFSSEGWINEGGKEAALNVINQFPEPVHIVMFVRPQVPVINSAYWQWGAWSDVEFEKWIKSRVGAAQWYYKYEQFLSIKNVASVKVKILGSDIIDDLQSAYGFSHDRVRSKNVLYNKSLSLDVLRLMQKYRSLRPGPHDSGVDFIISKFFGDLLSESTPWVLDHEMISMIQDKCREGNELLLEVLSSDDRDKMISDKRWWGSFELKSPIVSPLPQDDLGFNYEEFFVRALEVICRK